MQYKTVALRCRLFLRDFCFFGPIHPKNTLDTPLKHPYELYTYQRYYDIIMLSKGEVVFIRWQILFQEVM